MSKIMAHWPKALLVFYIGFFIYFSQNPDYFPIWVVENTIAVVTVLALVILYWRGVRFSNLAYSLMAFAICWQTVGGHYCFSGVPFETVTEFFGWKRNNYDRFGHFFVGFFAIAIMEYFESRDRVRGRLLNAFLAVMIIFGIAAIFEIIEWVYAALTHSQKSGTEFLGNQGDIFDAQKDMLCDGAGAILTAIIYSLRYWGKNVADVIGYKKK